MGAWNSGKGTSPTVNLLMVCVELGQRGLRTAQDFAHRFQLPPSVINGYVEQKRDAPSFGQLGCGGFVVIGPHGEITAKKTVPSYLEADKKGFTAVEKMFSSLWNISLMPASPAHPSDAIPKPLASVGVPEMDMEHEEIDKAVNELQRTQDPAVVRKLLVLWQMHSEHEEQLFEKFDFGRHRSAEQGTAATRGHCEHHRLISSMMMECIEGLSSPASQINKVAAEIQRHVAIYDAAYAGKLGSEAKH